MSQKRAVHSGNCQHTGWEHDLNNSNSNPWLKCNSLEKSPWMCHNSISCQKCKGGFCQKTDGFHPTQQLTLRTTKSFCEVGNMGTTFQTIQKYYPGSHQLPKTVISVQCNYTLSKININSMQTILWEPGTGEKQIYVTKQTKTKQLLYVWILCNTYHTQYQYHS